MTYSAKSVNEMEGEPTEESDDKGKPADVLEKCREEGGVLRAVTTDHQAKDVANVLLGSSGQFPNSFSSFW